jgi:hypothetical protein
MKLHDRVLQILLGLACVIAALIMVLMVVKPIHDTFIDLSSDEAKANNKLMETNIAWKDTLQYIQDNPDKSLLYLSTVKDLFFDEKCTFKKNLDFKDLASKYSTVFT